MRNIYLLFATTLIALTTVMIINCHNIKEQEEKDQAFKECLEEVSNKCGSLFEYATMLEAENARLNRECSCK